MKLLLSFAIAAGILLTSMFFFTGLHNIDNAWNMRYYEYKHGIKNLVDITVTGVELDANEAYRLGIATVCMAFIFSSLIMFLFGLYIKEMAK